MIEELRRLRVRLTAWYVGVFALVLIAFGAALFYVLTRQISARLDDALADAADELQRAALIREREGPPGPGGADAFDELRIPDRELYVFDAAAHPIHPDTVAPWLREIAGEALRSGEVMTERDLARGRTWRIYARRFTVPGSRTLVALTAADAVEIDHQYAGLLLAFALAALVALAFVGLGGWLLARRSTEPVRDAFQRMRGFTADAAHELRTPVAVLGGHAEVALRQPRSREEYVEILGAIQAEAARLGGIVENLLTIARADAAAWPVRFESVFLDDLLLDTIERARVIGDNRGVRINVSSFDELPVRGDPDLLRQLLMILLDNALKFTPVGGRVDAAALRHDTSAEVVVSDTGVGIPAARLPRVFDRFHRGDDARGVAHGAGLGLSIARWIIDAHNAAIDIDSEPGGGTTVRVRFPLDAAR